MSKTDLKARWAARQLPEANQSVLRQLAGWLGVALHQFALRLPAPTPGEFAFWCRRLSGNKEEADKLIKSWWKKLWDYEDHTEQPETAAHPRATSKPGIPAEVVPGGWRGTASFVRMRSGKGDLEQMLCGLAPLMAWVACGNSIDKIPPGGRRVVDPEHALWEVLEFMGEQTQWDAPVRADVAARFAGEVRMRLPAFQRALGLPQGASNGTNTVLAELCKVSPREVAYAIQVLNGPRNRSSKPAPKPQPKPSEASTPRKRGRTRPKQASQRPRSDSLTLVRLGEPPLPQDLADLALIELEFGELLRELRVRIKPEAIVAHIHNPEEGVEDERSPRVLEFLNDPSQHGTGKPPFVLREKGFLSGRAVMIFSQEDIEPPYHLPFEDDQKKSTLPGREGKRSCRTWIYKKLMETFCSGDARVVLAPLYDEPTFEASDEQRKENNSELWCFKKAASPTSRIRPQCKKAF